jgi:DNA-directed RNA polymerase specialized sigma24 family protein
MKAAVVTSRFGAGDRLQGMDTKHPFEKVVTDHGATVLRVCRVLLAGPDADDAWSETFLAALRAYPDLPETANTEAWLVTIAHRKAIDLLRARKRQPVPVEEIPERPARLGVPARTTQACGRRSASCPGGATS